MSRKQVINIPSTPHFDFLTGSFANPNWTVPYFITSMTFSDAATSLHLTSEIPGSEEITWSIDELYQRDIDWQRVRTRILPYLNKVEEPQFFNALTIALLPYSAADGSVRNDFSGTDWKAPSLELPERFEKTMSVGPIQLGYWNDWKELHDSGANSGQIRWNTHQLFGVAIDGQHRLAAIKDLVKGNPGAPEYEMSRVPVILLVFAEDLGFVAPRPETQVFLLRKLFIDLNKNAKTVKRARQILLDDGDPHAVCVRQLIGNELSEQLQELTMTPPRLPLSLVDWHTEQARFDTGPHLTTVLGLDYLVSSVLDTSPVGDFMAYKKIDEQVRKFEKGLAINLTDARKRLADVSTLQLIPFSYRDSDLELIGQGFGEVWSPALSHLLTKFEPYAELVNHRVTDKSLKLEFQSWFELHSRNGENGGTGGEYEGLIARLIRREDDPVSEAMLLDRLAAIDALKTDNLAFNVVFQRALFGAFVEFCKIEPGHISELEDLDDDEPEWNDDVEIDDSGDEDLAAEEPVVATADSDQDEDATSGETLTQQQILNRKNSERAEQFVAALNDLVQAWPEFLTVTARHEVVYDDGPSDESFWLGTIAKSEGGIDFTQAASTRAKDLLFVAAAMWLFDKTTEPDERSEFDQFWALCQEDNGLAICMRTKRAIKRFCNGESSAAGRILSAGEYEFEEHWAKELMEDRMRYLWEVMEL